MEAVWWVTHTTFERHIFYLHHHQLALLIKGDIHMFLSPVAADACGMCLLHSTTRLSYIVLDVTV